MGRSWARCAAAAGLSSLARPAPSVSQSSLKAEHAIVSWSQLPWRPRRGTLCFPAEPHCRAAICLLSQGDLPAHRPGRFQNFPFICISTPAGLLVGSPTSQCNPTPRGLASKSAEQGRREGSTLGGGGACEESA